MACVDCRPATAQLGVKTWAFKNQVLHLLGLHRNILFQPLIISLQRLDPVEQDIRLKLADSGICLHRPAVLQLRQLLQNPAFAFLSLAEFVPFVLELRPENIIISDSSVEHSLHVGPLFLALV